MAAQYDRDIKANHARRIEARKETRRLEALSAAGPPSPLITTGKRETLLHAFHDLGALHSSASLDDGEGGYDSSDSSTGSYSGGHDDNGKRG